MLHVVDWLGRNWKWGIATATAVVAVVGHCTRPGCLEWVQANSEALGAWVTAMLGWGAAAIRAAKAGEAIPEPPKVDLPVMGPKVDEPK